MKIGDIAFFVYGYSKKDRANIDDDELVALKKLAGILLAYSEEDLRKLIDSGEFREVTCDE